MLATSRMINCLAYSPDFHDAVRAVLPAVARGLLTQGATLTDAAQSTLDRMRAQAMIALGSQMMSEQGVSLGVYYGSGPPALPPPVGGDTTIIWLAKQMLRAEDWPASMTADAWAGDEQAGLATIAAVLPVVLAALLDTEAAP